MKKYKDESVYIYEFGYDQDIMLCPDCNMNLAGEIFRQAGIEIFLKNNPFELNTTEVIECQKKKTIKEKKEKKKKVKPKKEKQGATR